jgi:peptidoglycan/LPS O-acetylase OafA/YrhL
MRKSRVLFFDVLRILAVTIIVVFHSWGLYISKNPAFTIPVIGVIQLGTIGVALFVFVSGAVLELSSRVHPADYISFIKARIIRIFPAFWCALIILMLVIPLHHNIPDILLEFTGMGIYTLKLEQMIDGPGWFIGLIFTYYLIFPLITKWMERYGLQIAGISVGLTILGFGLKNQFPAIFSDMLSINIIQYIAPFIAGLYVVKADWHPKIQSSHYISWLAAFSFPVFLLHQPIIGYYRDTPVFAFSLFLALSLILMMIDTWIQDYVKKIPVK